MRGVPPGWTCCCSAPGAAGDAAAPWEAALCQRTLSRCPDLSSYLQQAAVGAIRMGEVRLLEGLLCEVWLCELKWCEVWLCEVRLCEVRLCELRACEDQHDQKENAALLGCRSLTGWQDINKQQSVWSA